MPAASALKRYGSFDGIRGIGAVIVIFSHLPLVVNGGLYNVLWGAEHTLRLGYILLDEFFLMSGFFITRILLDERTRAGRISLKDFYIRRSLRIFPLYYIVIVATSVAFRFAPSEVTSLLTYSFNYYHPFHPAPHPLEQTWSLAVEEQFYLFWPLLIGSIPLGVTAVVTGRIIPLIAIASGVGIAALCSDRDPMLSGDLVYMSLCTRMLSLSLGGWLAFREFEGKPLARQACILLLAAAVALLALDLSARSLGIVRSQALYWTIALSSYAMISVAVTSTLVFDDGRVASSVRGVLNLGLFRALGALSYALYLFHLPVLFSLHLNEAALAGGQARFIDIAEVLGITLALAILSQYLIERPCMALRRYFRPAAGRAARRASIVPDGRVGEAVGSVAG